MEGSIQRCVVNDKITFYSRSRDETISSNELASSTVWNSFITSACFIFNFLIIWRCHSHLDFENMTYTTFIIFVNQPPLHRVLTTYIIASTTNWTASWPSLWRGYFMIFHPISPSELMTLHLKFVFQTGSVPQIGYWWVSAFILKMSVENKGEVDMHISSIFNSSYYH